MTPLGEICKKHLKPITYRQRKRGRCRIFATATNEHPAFRVWILECRDRSAVVADCVGCLVFNWLCGACPHIISQSREQTRRKIDYLIGQISLNHSLDFHHSVYGGQRLRRCLAHGWWVEVVLGNYSIGGRSSRATTGVVESGRIRSANRSLQFQWTSRDTTEATLRRDL